jgi:hypothetical protein
MDDELRDLLAAQIEAEIHPHAPRHLTKVVERGRRRRAAGRLVTAAAVVCVIAAGSLAPRLPVFTSDEQAPAGGGEQPQPETLPNGCPDTSGTPDRIEWTSPTVRVAEGTLRGEPWVLCARTAEQADGSAETLCTDWRLGDGLSSGMDCVFSYDGDRAVPIDETYFDAIMGPDHGYLFGAAPASSASVALEKRDGTTVSGEIHPAPPDLDVPFLFFTLFDEPYSEGTLVVRDDSGEVLARREMEHGLSLLSVDVEGEGTVLGYRTELLRVYEECRRDGGDCRPEEPVWIECPPKCRAPLADARITLVAEPAEGATFAGWSGACSGAERCELVVDRTTNVTATFDSP